MDVARPADEVPGDGEWAAENTTDIAVESDWPVPEWADVASSTDDDGPNGPYEAQGHSTVDEPAGQVDDADGTDGTDGALVDEVPWAESTDDPEPGDPGAETPSEDAEPALGEGLGDHGDDEQTDADLPVETAAADDASVDEPAAAAAPVDEPENRDVTEHDDQDVVEDEAASDDESAVEVVIVDQPVAEADEGDAAPVVPSAEELAPSADEVPSSHQDEGPNTRCEEEGGFATVEPSADSPAAAAASAEPLAHPGASDLLRTEPVSDYTTSLNDAMNIDGALGVALVDSSSGMALATAGNPPGINLDTAAAGNSNVIMAKQKTMADLGLDEKIEDLLITLDTQYHIIRMFNAHPGIFLYLVLDKSKANLAMARFKLTGIERQLEI